MLLHVTLVALAAFWAWETVRYPLSRYAPSVYSASAPLHPVVVAGFAWGAWHLEDLWLGSLAAAALAGLMHILASKFAGADPTPQYVPQRKSRSDLPRLPG